MYKRQATDNQDVADYGSFLYRLSHPLGEHVISQAKAIDTAVSHLAFDVSHHPARLHLIESLKGSHGYLMLKQLYVESYEEEEYLLFSAIDQNGKVLDQETCEKLFSCQALEKEIATIPADILQKLNAEAVRHADAVSYTHLDVYKRQVPVLMLPACPCLKRRPPRSSSDNPIR